MMSNSTLSDGASVVGQCRSDVNHRITSIDDVFLGRLGYARHDMIGRLELDFTFDADRPASKALLARLERQNQPFAISKRYRKRDGSLIWVSNHVVMASDGVGSTCFLITSSLSTPVPDTIAGRWTLAKRAASSIAAGKKVFGHDLISAAPMEALLQLYMAESDGRSLSLKDLSDECRIEVHVAARWMTVLADRQLAKVERCSANPELAAFRIGHACHEAIDEIFAQTV